MTAKGIGLFLRLECILLNCLKFNYGSVIFSLIVDFG